MEVSWNVKMCGGIYYMRVQRTRDRVPLGLGISTYTDGNTNRASLSGAKKMEDA